MSKTSKQYKWREGSRPPRKVTAEVVGKELERIGRHGGLTTAKVVDAARPEDAPLHPAFEWNDKRAAEHYRLHQAATLVRSIVVVEAKPNGETTTSPCWAGVSLQRGDEGKPSTPGVRYLPAHEVASKPDLFADALGRLEMQMRSLQHSIRQLETLAQQESDEPERMARIAMATKALETASAALHGLH